MRVAVRGLITAKHSKLRRRGVQLLVVMVAVAAMTFGLAGCYLVTSTIGVGQAPEGVAVLSGLNTTSVFVANSVDGTVSTITDGHVTDTTTVGVGASGIAVDPTLFWPSVYVTNGVDTVTELFLNSSHGLTVAKTIAVGNYPRGVAVDTSTHAVYVANSGSNTVSVIQNGAVTNTIGVGQDPQGVGVDSSTHTLYVSNGRDATVDVINQGVIDHTIPVGANPFSVAVDSSSHTAYVSNGFSDSVSVINGNAVTATIPLDGSPYDVAVDPSTHTAYVATEGSTGHVSIIAGGAVTATVGVGQGPWGVGVDPRTHTAYVSDFADNTVSVVSRTPTVKQESPAPGATGVSINSNVLGLFDVAMNQASTAAAFSLARTSDGTPVAGSVNFYGDQLLVFAPSSPLAPATQYTATISTAASDTGGNHLAGPKSWSFTTS